MEVHFNYLKHLAKHLFGLKTSSHQDLYDFVEQRKKALLVYGAVKDLSRTKKFKIQFLRDKLQEEKLNADSNRLRLQNLLYEVNHLRREIRFCYKFKSGDEDIQLLSNDEYALLLKIECVKELLPDRHKLLEWELKLRKHLHEYLTELLERKTNVIQAIKGKVKRLSSYEPSLNALLLATTPLQNSLQIFFDTECKDQQLAVLLPKPLYCLYMNTRAFQIANVRDLRIAIGGYDGQENGKKNIRKQICDANSGCLPIELEGRDECLRPFPLMVQITVCDKEYTNISLIVSVRFFPKLQLSTASCEVNFNKKVDGSQDEDINITLNESVPLTNGILEQLSKGDVGKIVPVSTQYVLKQIQLSPDECLQQLKNTGYGKPFAWLQKMCNLESSEGLSKECIFKMICHITSYILLRLEYLWNCRINLLQQIKVLESKNVYGNLQQEKLPSIQILCNFTEWAPVSWDDAISNDLVLIYYQRGIVTEKNSFYKAVLERDSARMECLLNISPNFPLESPVWILDILHGGHQNALNNSAVKRIEQIANSMNEDYLENKRSLISYQLLFIMFGFDTFLETEEFAPDFCNHHEGQKLLMRFFNRQRLRALTHKGFKATNTSFE